VAPDNDPAPPVGELPDEPVEPAKFDEPASAPSGGVSELSGPQPGVPDKATKTADTRRNERLRLTLDIYAFS
jgi:hypothetical protein